MKNKIILGIDPGIGRCGFGVISLVSNTNPRFIDCGIIETDQRASVSVRLSELRRDFISLLNNFQPDLVAVEELFFTKNISTGIAVAEARGVLLEATCNRNFPLIEVKPQEMKIAVTGSGNANKSQVQEMVTRILSLSQKPTPDDAADALAIALAAQNFAIE